jgi:hypothetical protein
VGAVTALRGRRIAEVRLRLLGLATVVVVVRSAAAAACGLSPHVGPTGIIKECDGTSQRAMPWRVAMQGGAVSTELTGASQDIGFEQTSLSVRGERRLGTRFAVGMSAGSVVGGTLRVPGMATVDLGFGWTAGASVSGLALAEQAVRPFILASFSVAYSVTEASPVAGSGTFTGRDVRLGVAVGKSFGPARVYAAGRAFGGGYRWTGTSPAITGGDAHLYQVGAGVAVNLPADLDVMVEAMPLGERSLTAGVGWSF